MRPMGFEIVLEKPTGAELRDNRLWAAPFCDRFPHFEVFVVAPDVLREMATECATDDVTAEQFIERGHGLQLNWERDDFWMRVELWARDVTIVLPNFPEAGADAAIAEARPYIEHFLELGFVLTDGWTGEAIPMDDWQSSLVNAYARRRGQVERVAELVGGTAL